MKRTVTILLCMVLVFALAACNLAAPTGSTQPTNNAATDTPAPTGPEVTKPSIPDETQPPDHEDGQSSSNILVAYFSRTGTTKGVAEAIRNTIDGDIVEIKVATPYPEEYNDVLEVARQELSDQVRPEISTTLDHIDDYDVIFIGYPIWHGTCPMAVLTFLEGYDLTGKTIVPFATSGSSGISHSEGEIGDLFPDSTVLGGLGLSGSDASSPQASVTDWITGLDLPVDGSR